MSTRICTICGEIMDREAERSMCLLCRHRTLPAELSSQTRRLLGLIDSA